MGWRNVHAETGVTIERSERTPSRIMVERPFLSGAYIPVERGYRGAFILGGESDALMDGIMSLGLALMCEQRGDLLLHASAVASDGRTCLFLGPGGAGKTTIATQLSKDRTALCVDKAFVSARPDGVLRVYATPFGDGFGAPARRGRAAIAGLFFIEQAEEHAVDKLLRWEATRRLFGHAIAPSRDPASVQRTMDVVGRLADLDRSFRLRFRKDAGFWPLVDGVLSKG
jgi:hypothetical protein